MIVYWLIFKAVNNARIQQLYLATRTSSRSHPGNTAPSRTKRSKMPEVAFVGTGALHINPIRYNRAMHQPPRAGIAARSALYIAKHGTWIAWIGATTTKARQM